MTPEWYAKCSLLTPPRVTLTASPPCHYSLQALGSLIDLIHTTLKNKRPPGRAGNHVTADDVVQIRSDSRAAALAEVEKSGNSIQFNKRLQESAEHTKYNPQA